MVQQMIEQDSASNYNKQLSLAENRSKYAQVYMLTQKNNAELFSNDLSAMKRDKYENSIKVR